jgi:YbbR domain-containing protein
VPVEKPAVPNGYVLRGNLGDVAVTLRGPEGVVDRLSVADLRATLDLTGIDPGTSDPHDARVNVVTANDAVKVVDVSPATVSVRLERITSRMVAVQTKYANSPPEGLQVAPGTISPEEVKVTGPESSVALVTAVFATVRFGDVTTDLTQTAPPIPVDANGLAIDGLQVEPGVVVVTVPLLPTATTRTLPVLWNVRGSVANGYWISNVATDPVAVTVRGEQSVLAAMARVETVFVDVTGFSAPRSVRAPLILPDGVTMLNPVDAVVTVTVVPLAGTRPFSLAVVPQNVAAGFDATTDPSTVTIVVAGSAPMLAALAPDAFGVTVDATGRGAGSAAADVSLRLPSGVALQSVTPARVTLTIKAK